uniref:Uncharacterized protein n=1 Tax=Rhodnius prolixus TaxID=13249 RepID=T1H9T4_RHOPR
MAGRCRHPTSEGIYEGVKPVLFVLDPELIKLVLVKHFDHFTDRPIFKFGREAFLHKTLIALQGSEWKKTRDACTPAFSSGRLKAMVPLFIACAQNMVQYLKNITKEKGETEYEIKRLLINYTLDAIASTSFGVNLDSFSNPNSEFAKKGLKFQDIGIFRRALVILCIMFEMPGWITSRLPLSLFNRESLIFFAENLKTTRNFRTKNNIRRNDLLQLLLDAQAAPVEIIGENDEDIFHEKRELLDEETALAQSVFFFLAGFETSSTQLSMACYELAKNKDIQDKVRQDIQKHWNEGELTYEAINSMTYLDMVMAETLRMYPPVARVERVVTKPLTLNGLKLDVDTKIAVPVYGLHQDSNYYPEPMQFKPERFTQEEKAKRSPYVYLPFGAGPRNCIGLRFAAISSKICTAYLLKYFEIDVCEKTPIPFEFDRQAVFLKPKDDLYLKMTRI